MKLRLQIMKQLLNLKTIIANSIVEHVVQMMTKIINETITLGIDSPYNEEDHMNFELILQT